MYRHRFKVLLGALILLLLVAPLTKVLEWEIARRAVSLVFAAILLAAVFAVSKGRLEVLVTGMLVGLTIVLGELNSYWVRSDPLELVSRFLALTFLGYTVILIVRYLFVSERVTFETIAASLCAFLLLGVFWAVAYSVLELLMVDPFNVPLSDAAEMRSGEDTSPFALYFSFVTLTTLGYGDITPVSPVARMLAILEAVTGQLYLTVLVARLVGLHISHSRKSGLSAEE